MNEVKLEYYAKGVYKVVDIPEKSKGLGDTIEKITKATGIKWAVDKISEAVGKDCGCEQRKQTLNKLVPYKK